MNSTVTNCLHKGFVFATVFLLLLMAVSPTAAQRARPTPGVYEGEALARSGRASASVGNVSSQPMADFGTGWSGNAQLLWAGGQPGAELDLTLDAITTATYAVGLEMTRAPDYGQLQIKLDGKDAATFDGYAPTVAPSGSFSLGSFELAAGIHKLSFIIIGKNANATGFLVGIDRILLTVTARIADSRRPSVIISSSGTSDPARLVLRTTLEIWDGIGTVDNAPPNYGTEAVFEPNRSRWLWSFRWSTTVVGAKGAALVASREQPAGTDPPLAPQGLVGVMQIPGEIPTPGVTQEFSLDIGPWMPQPRTRGALQSGARLFLRVVLLDANGQPFAPPSAPVMLRRGAQTINTKEVFAAAEKAKAETEAMKAKASIYDVKIIAHKPIIFPDINKWGCIEVLKNPYYQPSPWSVPTLHPLWKYKPGEKYCPPTDPATQQKSTWEWIETGLEGWAKAYDGLAHFYDEAKGYVASKFASAIPCQWLGKKLEGDCKDAAKQLAGTAISVGLAAAGVPPTLPDLAALGDMAEGKVVDAAVDYSCNEFESHGGVCTPEMREQLAKLYRQALNKLRDEIKRNGKEPDCGDAKTANELGLLPLPCFTNYPGTDVKPAPGSTYEPSIVTVRVTRVKPDPDFAMPGCSVTANLLLKNQFPGGMVGGAYVKPAPLSGYAFVDSRVSIPLLGLGKSVDLTLLFTQIQKQLLPGMYDPHYGYVGWQNLYVGGKGSLFAGASTDHGIPLPNSPNVPQIISCGQDDEWNVEIPKQ